MLKTSTVIIIQVVVLSALVVGGLLYKMLEPSGFPNPFKDEKSEASGTIYIPHDSTWLDPGRKFVSLQIETSHVNGLQFRESLVTRNMLPNERCDTFIYTSYITDLAKSGMTITGLAKKVIVERRQ